MRFDGLDYAVGVEVPADVGALIAAHASGLVEGEQVCPFGSGRVVGDDTNVQAGSFRIVHDFAADIADDSGVSGWNFTHYHWFLL